MLTKGELKKKIINKLETYFTVKIMLLYPIVVVEIKY